MANIAPSPDRLVDKIAAAFLCLKQRKRPFMTKDKSGNSKIK